MQNNFERYLIRPITKKESVLPLFTDYYCFFFILVYFIERLKSYNS